MPKAVVRCRTYSSNSTKLPLSTSSSMRWRAVSLPLACCFCLRRLLRLDHGLRIAVAQVGDLAGGGAEVGLIGHAFHPIGGARADVGGSAQVDRASAVRTMQWPADPRRLGRAANGCRGRGASRRLCAMPIPDDGYPRAAAVSPRLQVAARTASTNADLVAAVSEGPADGLAAPLRAAHHRPDRRPGAPRPLVDDPAGHRARRLGARPRAPTSRRPRAGGSRSSPAPP